MGQSPTSTTTAGAPVADHRNSLTAGARDPLLLQDHQSSSMKQLNQRSHDRRET